MDGRESPSIPSAMRPSKSLIAHVRSTLSDLVSSVFKPTNGNKKSVDKIQDTNEDINKTVEASDFCGEPLDDSQLSGNGEETVKSSPTKLSRSQQIRTKEAYRKRLKSFTLSLWCGKPLGVSPPLLAQYGWECVGESMAKCCICGATISIHLPWPNSSNYHAICKEAKQKVIKGHKKICSLPTSPVTDMYLNPFDEDFLSLEDKQSLKQDFIEKANRLYELKYDLPHLTLDTLVEMGLDEDFLGKMIQLCGFRNQSVSTSVEEDIIQHAMHLSSVVLALCGWDKEPNNVLPTLRCEETGRTIGLWNFYSVSPEEDKSSPCAVKKRRLNDETVSVLIVEKSWFHPVSQHHVWSPWIISLNSISALLEDSAVSPIKNNVKPGWKVLRDFLLDIKSTNGDPKDITSAPNSHKTPPRMAVLQARRMLKDWSSP